MNTEYLIWAVLNKESLAVYERQQIAELLEQLKGATHGS